MKKLILMMFTALIAVSASAQELERSKFFDNTFVGVSSGVGAWLKPINNGFTDFGNSIHSVSTARVGSGLLLMWVVSCSTSLVWTQRSCLSMAITHIC